MEKWALVQPLVEQLAPLRDLGLLSALSLVIDRRLRDSLYMSLGQNMTIYIS